MQRPSYGHLASVTRLVEAAVARYCPDDVDSEDYLKLVGQVVEDEDQARATAGLGAASSSSSSSGGSPLPGPGGKASEEVQQLVKLVARLLGEVSSGQGC